MPHLALVLGVLLAFPICALAEEAVVGDAPSSLMHNEATKIVRPPTPVRITQSRVIDTQFLILSTVSATSIFIDSYTTTWIGENYRARHHGACTVEGGEPALYGLHPGVSRAYTVGAGLSASAIALSYVGKKYLPSRIKWMWRAPLLYEASISIRGFATNLERCDP